MDRGQDFERFWALLVVLAFLSFILLSLIYASRFTFTIEVKKGQAFEILNQIRVSAGIKTEIKLLKPTFLSYVEPVYAEIIKKKDGTAVILICSGVLSWPKEELSAIIAHELGHLVLGHTDQTKDFSNDDTFYEAQAEADVWAVKQTSRQALIKMFRHFSAKEAQERTKKLDKLLKQKNLSSLIPVLPMAHSRYLLFGSLSD